MNSVHFSLIGLALVGCVYVVLRDRGDIIGWWIGLAHAVLATIGFAGWESTSDIGFATSMALLSTYAAAMSASEIVTRLRSSPARP